MSLLEKIFPLLLLLSFACFASARRVNITYLDNCQEHMAEDPPAYVTHVSYHFAEDGTCDVVHADLQIKTIDEEPLELIMTLFKCEQSGMGNSCMDNPTVHEELLDCHRLMNDDSGPWHMITSSMNEGQCGDKVGDFKMNFARLRLEYLMKYLDVYDANFKTFRLKMYFKSTLTQKLRGCGELDFELLPV